MTLHALLLPRISSRSIVLIAVAIMTSACGEPLTRDTVSPTTFPSSIPGLGRNAESTTTQREDLTFPLLNGSFRLSFGERSNAGTVSGSYTGTAVAPTPDWLSATLVMSIRRATRAASDITELEGEGTGAGFVGEGDFTLSLKLSTQDGAISAKLRGTSTISCSAEQRILVTMRGTGSALRLGDVDVELQHEVGNTFCFDK